MIYLLYESGVLGDFSEIKIGEHFCSPLII